MELKHSDRETQTQNCRELGNSGRGTQTQTMTLRNAGCDTHKNNWTAEILVVEHIQKPMTLRHPGCETQTKSLSFNNQK